ncbi:MAG: hypothetical protein N2645_22640 [Clostridia bacterium]|nr:hypothetical protein [Clostridia bacterium]
MQQIISLKLLGFSLGEIKKIIENPTFNPAEVIKFQLESVKEHILLQEQLYNRLEGLYELLITQQEVNTEKFIELIEVIKNMNTEKYFTQEQLEKMKILTGRYSPEEK